MNKLTLIIFVISFILCSPHAIAEEPENYRKDSESWIKCEKLARKYPNDPDIQLLHALRIGVCAKIEMGSIRHNLAVDIFDQAYNYVLEKPVKNERKTAPNPVTLKDYKKQMHQKSSFRFFHFQYQFAIYLFS